jgi:hypothetical protein
LEKAATEAANSEIDFIVGTGRKVISTVSQPNSGNQKTKENKL